MNFEQWSLGTATATVEVKQDRLTVTLRGIITTSAYEALHIRLGRARHRLRLLVIADDALIVASARSLAEAAVRGTPARQLGSAHAVVICVSPWRAGWAFEHCAVMTAAGLYRATGLRELAGVPAG